MYNLLLSLAAGAVVALAIAFGTSYGWVAAVFPGFLVATALYVYVAFRVRKQMEAIGETVQRELTARHVDKAILALQGAFRLSPWMFQVKEQLHSQIGTLRYLTGDLDEAVADLEKSLPRGWFARLVNRDGTGRLFLATARYRRRDVSGALALYEEVVGVSDKHGLAWSVYAWVLEKEGRHEDAIRVLGRGVAKLPKDANLQESLQALQNGKKLKLWKLYPMEWYQFGLEAPPAVDPTGGRARRQVFRRR